METRNGNDEQARGTATGNDVDDDDDDEWMSEQSGWARKGTLNPT